MKLSTSLKIVLLSLICIFSLGACTKDKTLFGSEAKGQLMGSWTQTPQAANETRTVFFGIDDSFVMQVTYFTGTTNFGSTYTGTYQIDGNKLIIKIDELIATEPNKPPTVIKNIGQFFDKATFKIDANRLTVDFVTYPADGPAPTQLKFLKN